MVVAASPVMTKVRVSLCCQRSAKMQEIALTGLLEYSVFQGAKVELMTIYTEATIVLTGLFSTLISCLGKHQLASDFGGGNWKVQMMTWIIII